MLFGCCRAANTDLKLPGQGPDDRPHLMAFASFSLVVKVPCRENLTRTLPRPRLCESLECADGGATGGGQTCPEPSRPGS